MVTSMAMVINEEQAIQYLDQLDLSYIVDVMCSPDYPLPRWTLSEARRASQLYKNFLLLQKKHSKTPLVPTRQIDEFWHNHILYTKNYSRDCMKIFGYYLHHEPASKTEDTDQLVNNFLKTKQLYLETFQSNIEGH